MAVVTDVEVFEQLAVRLSMLDGSSVACGKHQRWLSWSRSKSNWAEAKYLRQEGSYPSQSKIVKVLNVWTEDTSRGGGYLAAAVDGEGSLSSIKKSEHSAVLHLVFAQRKNEMSEFFDAVSAGLGFSFKRYDRFNYCLMGGRAKILEFLGAIRPPRLLGRFRPENLGTLQSLENVPVKRIERAKYQTVVSLKTTTGTMIINGFVACDGSCKTYASQKSRGRIVSFQGKDVTLSDAIAMSGLREGLVRLRINNGWSPERALAEPARAMRKVKCA